ncbi:DUF2625 family protein [Saccharibacillus sp. O23]|uniref:DUF2625 family protein n=1 Tax=Saccharibacillus sp. O23 TaxID=2009338 RepID=UPI0015C5B42E|nr:DUF2625 family protein [Saccharibacillus sp. O23]
MKKLEELLSDDSAWPSLLEAAQRAENEVRILGADRRRAEETLVGLQTSDRTTLGAVALNSGGLWIDRGWLKVLGCGHDSIAGDLRSWNGLGPDPLDLEFEPEGYVIAAYDVAGGFFAINNGAFNDRTPNVYYFAPDTLEWEDTEKGYTDFLAWAMDGDLEQYYATFRWKGWQDDIRALQGGQGMSIVPFPWSKESRDANKAVRTPIAMTELWDRQQEMSRQTTKPR